MGCRGSPNPAPPRSVSAYWAGVYEEKSTASVGRAGLFSQVLFPGPDLRTGSLHGSHSCLLHSHSMALTHKCPLLFLIAHSFLRLSQNPSQYLSSLAVVSGFKDALLSSILMHCFLLSVYLYLHLFFQHRLSMGHFVVVGITVVIKYMPSFLGDYFQLSQNEANTQNTKKWVTIRNNVLPL